MSDRWNILYEDNEIIVVHKMPGIATESANISAGDLVSELKKYLKRKGEGSYVGMVHRLDQPVEGILVFGKTVDATNNLTKQVAYDEKNGKGMVKKYKALVYGCMLNENGSLIDYLVKNKDNTSSVVEAAKAKVLKAKKAILDYSVIENGKDTQLVDINLKTGRHHQIRVQLANAGCPIVGDLKYGNTESINYSNDKGYSSVQLVAYKLELTHPKTNKRISFEI